MNAAKTVKTTLYTITLPSGKTTSVKKLPNTSEPDALWLDYTPLKDVNDLRLLARMLEDVADDMEGKIPANVTQCGCLGGNLYDNLADSANIN